MSAIDLLIEKINRLQDICSENNIASKLDLPQIVVIGSQSSGKSSVLENIVGRDILPRGTGIVTKRPLILQLIYNKAEDYAVFNHIPDKKFTNFEEVKNEILAETNRILKSKNDVSAVPITLKYYSSRVLTLTLVDLPGLVRVPTNDQPKDICAKITDMCRRYVMNRNALVLAVSSANTDIANSDALQLAREVDCNYERTIGVLTKVDLMDTGTDVVEVLAGRVINLKLGFVPVVNRSQTDIEKKKDIAAALGDEEKFFASHSSYKKNRMYCGTAYLVLKLHNILHEHIKQCLPELQESINSTMLDAQQRLKELGYSYSSPKEIAMKIISTISQRFSDTLRGNTETKSSELAGGARLSYTLNNHFAGFMSKLNALDNIKDEQIRVLLYNSGGSSPVLFFAQTAFERLSKASVQTLKPHGLKLVSIVLSELVKITREIVDGSVASRYPRLGEKIVGSMARLLKERSETTHRLVEAFVDWNVAHISTKHPDFVRWNELLVKEMEGQGCGKKAETIDFYKNMEGKMVLDSLPSTLRIQGAMSQQEVMEIGIIRSMVTSYFEIIKKIVTDQIPKAIMSELVRKSESQMQETLFRDVYEKEDLNMLISESREIEDERKSLEVAIKALKQAYDIICSL
jgi:vacuolar protein sorting-associated protein 1